MDNPKVYSYLRFSDPKQAAGSSADRQTAYAQRWAAIRRQCLAWQAGTFRGVIRNGKDPKWVRWTGTGFDLVPERAAAMRAAITLFLAGHGGYRVMRALREQGYTADQVPTTSGTLYKALKRPDLIGTKTLAIDGEEWALEGYYPALLIPAEYQQLQAANLNRVKRKCADSAPWADGRVYRVGQDWRDSAGFAPQRGRLVYTAPGAPFAFPLRGGTFDD